MTAKTKPAPAANPTEAASAGQGWRPEPGDTVEGTVVQIEKVDSEYGAYPMVTLDTANGFVNVHAFHSVLLKQLSKLAPRPGDRVRITFHGKVQNKDTKKAPYNNYTAVNPDKPVEAFNWDDTTEDAAF